MKQQVFMSDWMLFHPYKTPTSTDFYYLKIAQKIFPLLTETKHEYLLDNLYVDEKKLMACFLTAWFEDVISESGMWLAFINLYKERYGKYLPFYETGDDYFPGDMNQEDLYFLIWYFFSLLFKKEEYLIYPLDTIILHLGDRIFALFDQYYYEEAPENEKLIDFLSIPKTETDFYKIRIKLEWLVFHSYLFHFNLIELDEEINKLEESNTEEEFYHENKEKILYGLFNEKTFNLISSLMALKGNEWLAKIVGKKHPLYQPLMQLSDKMYSIFIFRGYDEQNVHLEHAASGKIIEVTRKSLTLHPNMKEGETILGMSVIKWMGEWWFTGIYSLWDYNEQMIEEQRNNPEEKRLFYNEEDKKSKLEAIERQEQVFLEFNNGLPYRFFSKGNEVEEFVKEFIRFYNLKLAKKSKRKRSRKKEKIFQKNIKQTGKNLHEINERYKETDGLVFFNRGKGLETLFGYNVLLDKTHPKRKDLTENEILDMTEDLLIRKDASNGIIRYFVTQGKIPFIRFHGEKPEEHLLLNHLDFILGFYDPNDYRSMPRVSFV